MEFAVRVGTSEQEFRGLIMQQEKKRQIFALCGKKVCNVL
jgi:hypothetical protein